MKTSRYGAAGLENYWIVDCGARELLVYRLRDGAYEQAQVVGETAEVSLGIATVTVTMADLLR